jgi:hypothetical protein
MPFQALLSADVGGAAQQFDAAVLDPGLPRLEVIEQMLARGVAAPVCVAEGQVEHGVARRETRVARW